MNNNIYELHNLNINLGIKLNYLLRLKFKLRKQKKGITIK